MASTSTESSCGYKTNEYEAVRELITAQLKKDGIQLWLAPYTQEENGEVGQFPRDLVERYSSLFKITGDEVATVIEILRENAVRKLAANRKFKACGVATIKLKFVDKTNGLQNENIETGLHVHGSHLKEKVKIMIKCKDTKLICCGRIIADDKTLEEQGVHNNSLVMVICSHGDQMVVEESTVNQVARTKHAANILASKKQDGDGLYENYYLEISDQNGKPLNLPDKERKSLVLAMSLHEQGKKFVREKKFTQALVLFLGADEEFRQCRSEVLNAVDNYAILCLDIVWCYLQLRSIKELPHAEEMLKKCEVCLKKSYGENLERLVFLKGNSAQELVLYVRLNLLQAICAFHKGDMKQSSSLFDKVENNIANLRVDDSKLSQMLSMGFNTSESRLALRSCHGDVTAAVEYISKKREERKRQIKESKEKKRKQKLAEKLGKTVNGEWINVDTYNMLLEMGFPEPLAKESLRQTNNNLEAALQIVEERPEILEFSTTQEQSFGQVISDDIIAQVTAMGFDVATAKSVLEYFHGNVSRTIEKLLECGGTLPPECQEIKKKNISRSGHDGGETSKTTSDNEKEVEEALKEMSGAFNNENSEESHLDLTLEEEATYVTEYRTLIATRAQMEKQ